ncbi:MAG: DNA-binding response regulator [Spirochaetaceae bacterium]|nr:DNA-binding response regulator [Spirochaetaceae bacterium]|tara:strand:- start:28989 stop:29831 length:843 start_codon:yes stop_codon:yes gene_type:complete
MPPIFDGTVIIVEDEPAIADALSISLDMEGFRTRVASTGADCLKILESQASAFVVLDVGLPDQTGFDVLKTIRTRYTVPVLMLTARTEEIDRILGLELGADDYVTKPFSPREVVSRIKAILRRWSPEANPAVQDSRGTQKEKAATSIESSENNTAGPERDNTSDPDSADRNSAIAIPADQTRQYGPFSWSDEEKLIYYRGSRLALSPYEFGTLRLLLQRPGMVFSREQIMDHVWTEPEDSFDRAVDTVIKNIRNAIRKVDAKQEAIETRRGMGYCLRRDL